MSANATCKDCATENGCPLWMNDGRSFGDIVYASRCETQYRPFIGDHLPDNASSYEFKQFLVQNAEKIMQQERRKALERAMLMS
jgi:hypothetical protein